ncbi:MAG: EF-P lysine aminoacylase EpmA [Planctomyces sp.]
MFLRAVREYFHRHGYLEVETPLLSSDIVVDAHLEPFRVETTHGIRFLQTSPEAGMKRLLAAGSGSIYQITRSFRSGESGRLHNPEFSMLEWYGVGNSADEQMAFTESLIRDLASALSADDSISRPEWLPPSDQRFRRVTYDEAFRRVLGFTVVGKSTEQLLRDVQLHRPGIDVSIWSLICGQTDADEVLNILLATFIEPALGKTSPEFLTNYPVTQAALARRSVQVPGTAERFELYIRGIEICNGYFELTDAQELQERDRCQNRKRSEDVQLPGASQMLAAMSHGLPDCAGVALGLDRLLMLILNHSSVSEVMAFPSSRA